MFKKLFVMGAGLILLLALFFGRSHVSTTVGMVRESVKESVPIDFEIKRARQMIKELRPEIKKNMILIAREEVEVDSLEDQVVALDQRLNQDRNDIVRLKDDLDRGSETFVYAGLSYSAKRVETELTSRFDQFKTQAATLDSKKQILTARQRGLTAAREKVDGMLDAKRQLEVEIENLEARLAMVDVAQTTSNFKFDNSRLSHTQELVADISTRIEVAEKLVNADLRYFDRIPLDAAEVDRDIAEEVADYFGGRQPEIEAFVKAHKQANQ